MLMALSRSDLHGYGIKHAVEEQTAGRLRLGPRTLYEAIHRMEGDGWIEEVAGPKTRGKPRRTYRITDKGRARMQDELDRLAQIVGFAREHELMPRPKGA